MNTAAEITAVLAQVCDHYGFGVDRHRVVARHTNTIVRVDTTGGQRVAVRIARRGLHTAAQVATEVWWTRRLAAAGCPVAAPIANRAGTYTTRVESLDGSRTHVVVWQWLRGSNPDDGDSAFWPRLGGLAAELHDHARGLRLPASTPQRRWDRPFPFDAERVAVFDRHSIPPHLRRRWRTVEAAVERFHPLLAARYDNRSEPPMILHGDLHDGNVMSYRGSLSAFDFEDWILGYEEHDLGVALYGPYYNSDDYPAVLAAFRGGYEAVRAWPLPDPRRLELLFAARALLLINFCLQSGDELVAFVDRLLPRLARALRQLNRWPAGG